MRRLEFDVDQHMDQLVTQTGCGDMGELIRRAVSLYGILCQEKFRGNNIQILDPSNGVKGHLKLP